MKRKFLLFFCLISISIHFSQAQQYWSLSGNSSISSSNYLGTTNNNPVIFKVNNIISGFTGYEDGKYNVSFGYKSLAYTAEGAGNTAFGAQALQYARGDANTAVGHWALANSGSGASNVAIGSSALTNSKTNYNVGIGQAVLQNNAAEGNTAIGHMSALTNTTGKEITATGFKSLSANTTGSANTANGYNALLHNTTGTNNTAIGAWTLISNTTGMHNTAIGMNALYTNTTGEYNTALGVQTMQENTTGYWNVGLGSGALYSNTTGFMNTAVGTSAMWFNITGEQNTAFGEEALAGNTNGSYNTAIGTRALFSVNNAGVNTIGYGHSSNNTALGFESLKGITTGSENIAIGVQASAAMTTGTTNIVIGNHALSNNLSGSKNIIIGHESNNNKGDLSNTIVIGNNIEASANNQIRIGNSEIVSMGSYINWTTLIDSSSTTEENVPGLEFINKLQPVTYANKSIQSGFIPEEVQDAATQINYNFGGVDKDDTNIYGLRYAEFIAPMVKAIQELSARNTVLEQHLEELIKVLQEQNIDTGNEYITNETNEKQAALVQNYPNPFNQSTNIEYFLPASCSKAHIVISDPVGNKVKTIALSEKGKSTINVETASNGPATYLYSLFVDEQLVDTKKMIQTR